MTSYFALLLLVAALCGLAVVAALRRGGPLFLAACGAGVAACAAVVLAGLPVASLNLPFGPDAEIAPGATLVVAFGPAQAPFLLALFWLALSGGLLRPSRQPALAAPVALAGAALLCVDRVHLAPMLAVLAAALWSAGRRRKRPGRYWRHAVWPVAAGLAALGLGAGRAPWVATGCATILSVALARSGATAGWLPAAGDRASGDRAAGWAGGIGLIAGLALAWRALGWSLAAPEAADALPYASPAAIALRSAAGLDGAVMLGAGVLVAAVAVWHGLRAGGLRNALAESGMVQLGLVWVAVGLAALAAGASLPALAAAARDAVWLGAVVAMLARIAGLCALETLTAGAGHDGFDRLGGLAWLMPRQSAVLAASLAQPLALPPLAGFAAAWSLMQVLEASPAIGDLGLRCVVLASTVAVAAALAGLAAIAWRGVVLALLGRPRTPRTAGAEDRGGIALWLPGLPLGLLTLCGLWPGLVRRGGAVLVSPAGGVLAPPVIVVPALLLAAAAWLGWRRLAPARDVAAWQDGAPPPPPWLPFGDPQTQPGPDFLRPGPPWPDGPGPVAAMRLLSRRLRTALRVLMHGRASILTDPRGLAGAGLFALACLSLLAVAL